MKSFLKIYGTCLIFIEVFFFFGGWMLFDLTNGRIWRAGAVIALLLAAAVRVWCGMEERLETLETELQELKNQMQSKQSESEDILS